MGARPSARAAPQSPARAAPPGSSVVPRCALGVRLRAPPRPPPNATYRPREVAQHHLAVHHILRAPQRDHGHARPPRVGLGAVAAELGEKCGTRCQLRGVAWAPRAARAGAPRTHTRHPRHACGDVEGWDGSPRVPLAAHLSRSACCASPPATAAVAPPARRPRARAAPTPARGGPNARERGREQQAATITALSGGGAPASASTCKDSRGPLETPSRGID